MVNKKYAHPLDVVLDRPIAFHRGFKDITGSTVAALLLSQLWYWAIRTSNAEGWFYKTQEEWEHETGLTRTEQETARKVLKRLGILEEKRVGIPAQLYYRINKQRVAELLGFQSAETLQSGKSSLQESTKQDCGIPTNINRYSETTAENTYGEQTETASLGADAPARASIDERIAAYPADVREGVQLMHDLFNLIPPEKPAPGEKGGEFAKWINGVRGLLKAAQEYKIPFDRAMKLAHQRWNQSPFTVSHPGALLKAMTGVLAQHAQSQTPPNNDNEFSLAEHLKNFKPRSTKT